MIGSWWLVWTLFMFVFVLSPVTYGWGYRGWGPPYPRFVQRRRAQAATIDGRYTTFNHESWGRGGDLLWLFVAVAIFWAVSSSFWWR